MARAPLISVVMPVYNARDTLTAAIRSIQHQTLQDWELIVFDDGSSDGSPDQAEELAGEDVRIQVIRSAHVGIVAGLQRACAQARGTFIARMDADDISLPTRFEKQVCYLETHPDVVLCGTQVAMLGDALREGRLRYEGWMNGLNTPEEIERELFVECPVAHPTFMMRRAAYEAVGGYKGHDWPEDYDLVVRLWQRGGQIGQVPEPLLQWREAPDRLSMNCPRYGERAFRALKRHYLTPTFLRSPGRFFQWGAGEVGKRWLREWEQPRPEAVVDIRPGKIGQTIHGFMVIRPEDLPGQGNLHILIAVGTPGARQLIRDWLNPRGYNELEDYIFIA